MYFLTTVKQLKIDEHYFVDFWHLDFLGIRNDSIHRGRVAKWLERLTAEQNIDGSSRTLES